MQKGTGWTDCGKLMKKIFSNPSVELLVLLSLNSTTCCSKLLGTTLGVALLDSTMLDSTALVHSTVVLHSTVLLGSTLGG
jgi:hypothetical protein